MKVLVLGGTKFVGRHTVQALLAAGHTVSVLTRGQSPDELPGVVERLRGDRDQGAAGLSALEGRTWDACVDVSGYTPRQVRASAEALRDRVGRYVLISTVSVYAEPGRHPIREDDLLLPPAAEDVTEVTNETYGPLKVTCERVVQEVYGPRCAALRPQLVAGPFDHTFRTTYWPDRVARSQSEPDRPILAPGDGSDHLQLIDARDIGRFVVQVVQRGLAGTYNLAGPRLTWADYLGLLGARNTVWVGVDELTTHALGFRELPVFIPDRAEQGGLMDVSNERAVQTGLTLTPPEVTARDTRAWSAGMEHAYPLTPEREAEVLAALGSSAGLPSLS